MRGAPELSSGPVRTAQPRSRAAVAPDGLEHFGYSGEDGSRAADPGSAGGLVGTTLEKMNAADLELARLCADGDERAWERFVREYRPILYRAADALDRTQGAREIADSLYAELYGIKTAEGERQSLLRYYQGRSTLATWLRAVLAQRYVDRMRVQRRLESLPDEETAVH